MSGVDLTRPGTSVMDDQECAECIDQATRCMMVDGHLSVSYGYGGYARDDHAT